MENYQATHVFDVRGRTALITGGTKGLGRAMAEGLIQNGCHVTLASRNTGGTEDLEELAARHGCRCHLHACDVTDTARVVDMVRAAEEAMGRIDILINAAGMNRPKLLEDMDDATWDEILDLDLRACFIVTRETARVMRRQKYGKIINISSMKLACELAADGITANAIAPTFIKTAINARQLEDPIFYKSLTSRIPVGRIGEFRDLMGLLLLLASDASQFITGQVFLLDGGIAARQ